MLSSLKSFELFFEHATDLLFVASPEGQLISANESLRQAIGTSPAEPYSLDRLFAKPTWHAVHETATSGPTPMTSFELQTTAGVTIGVLGKVFIEEESGNLCGLFRANSLAPVSDPLHDTAHQLRAILATIPDAVIVLDKSGYYRHVYTGQSDLLVDESLVGKRLHDVMSQQEADLGVETIAEVLRLQQLVTMEYKLNIRGADRWFSGRVVPFGGADDPCALWVATDISDLIAARHAAKAEHELIQELLDLGEKERKLIACEIHDGFVQHAVGAQMWLESVKEDLTADQASAREAIEVVSQSIVDAILEARQMISSLRPIVTDTVDLELGIANMAYEFRKQTAADIQISVAGDLDSLPPMMAGVALRITQEAMRNAVRHSQAQTISVSAEADRQQLVLSVYDDGGGFDLSDVPSERFGLVGIRRRAEVFSGEAQIVSAPGAGTKIDVRIPLKKQTTSGRT